MRTLLILNLFLFSIIHAVEEKGEKLTNTDPIKTYTLIVKLLIPPSGATQELHVDLDEGESFRITAKGESASWSILGKLGNEDGDVIPLELTSQYYEAENSNLTSSGPYSLKLSGESTGMSGSFRFSQEVSIRKNRK